MTNSTLAGLLRLLLDLPDDTITRATRSFAGWVDAHSFTSFEEPDAAEFHASSAHLLLIDTRDREARLFLPEIDARGSSLVAALVLAGCEAPGARFRKLLRRLRHPGRSRMPEREVRAVLERTGLNTTRLVFDGSAKVPDDFAVHPTQASAGTAFLLTRRPVFQGPVWQLIRERLSETIQVQRIQLRERGAAIVMARDGSREYAIRVVAPGPVQDVVLRNALSLDRLRRSLVTRPQMLELLPEPLFTDHVGGIAVLAETRLQGSLAWTVREASIQSRIYDQAIRFLDELRKATLAAPVLGCAPLIEADLQHLRDASFLSTASRQRVEKLLTGAAKMLSGIEFRPYASHGDFGYGNILVDPEHGTVTGVIDWDTARLLDFPGIDRVNLEIQLARTGRSFEAAVRRVWDTRAAHPATQLDGSADETALSWALFVIGICRYITRALSYPAIYRREATGFERALSWIVTRGSSF